jgi:predicted TIM-barrel fold metal-dependent hydrolase
MITPWGELAVSDAHVHFFSRPFFQALAGQTPLESVAAKLAWEIPGPDAKELARRWVDELDRYGLKRAAIIASFPGDEGSVVEAVRAYPERFFGYFMLNPVAEGAVERARAAVEAGGLRGICLFPAMHRFAVQDERLRPIYELAAGHRAVVFVHQGVLTVGVRKRLGLPSHFDMSLSNPIDLHRVALEHPAVKFVIPHFGAGYFRETLMIGDLCPNVYVDTSSTNSWIRYATGVHDLKEVFARTLEVFGASRVVFGSDSSFFPRGWNQDILKTQAEILNQLGVTGDAAQAILGGNLERLVA